MDVRQVNTQENIKAQLCCTITKKIMKHPVVIENGQTYEREAIIEWFKTHNTCPNTGEIIRNKNILIPNFAIRGMIDTYTHQKKMAQQKEAAERVYKHRRVEDGFVLISSVPPRVTPADGFEFERIKFQIQVLFAQLNILNQLFVFASAVQRQAISNHLPNAINNLLNEFHRITDERVALYNKFCDDIQDKISDMFYSLIDQSTFLSNTKRYLRFQFKEIAYLKNQIQTDHCFKINFHTNVAQAKIQKVVDELKRHSRLYHLTTSSIFAQSSQGSTHTQQEKVLNNSSKKRKRIG